MMTLEKFVQVMHKTIDGFAADYKQNREEAEDKVQWPLELTQMDWEEQFGFYIDLGGSLL